MSQMLYCYHHHTLAISGGIPTIPQLPSLPVHLLNNDHIEDCFMTMYHDMQDYIARNLEGSTSVVTTQSYKLAKHIGVMRERKWVPQYDSLFILQNERGEILFWQLSMGLHTARFRRGCSH